VSYFTNILIGIDQLANVVLLGGYPDETFSAECWRKGKTSWYWDALRIGIDALFWFDKQHCFSSYISEFERKQLPEEYRK
jgi:hypothetical protein